MIAPHLSEFDDVGQIVTIGNSTFSIGNDAVSKISITGFFSTQTFQIKEINSSKVAETISI